MRKCVLGVLIFCGSLFSSSVSFPPQDNEIIAQAIIKNNQEIVKLKNEIDHLKEIVMSSKEVRNEYLYKMKVVNVNKYAHFRETPLGKIKQKLPIGTVLDIESCNTVEGGFTWCYSQDFGGGYISSKLVKWTEILRKE